jgi:hypothetical protein
MRKAGEIQRCASISGNADRHVCPQTRHATQRHVAVVWTQTSDEPHTAQREPDRELATLASLGSSSIRPARWPILAKASGRARSMTMYRNL